MMHNHLKGKFHAHITLLTDDSHFVAPSGWKTTIVLLAKGDRKQKDVMITRHYVTDTAKTSDVDSMLFNMRETVDSLINNGHTVIREKLEHESLPTIATTEANYRECHIKIKKPNGCILIPVGTLVESSNPMVQTDEYSVVFMNARFYAGCSYEVDHTIDQLVNTLVITNHQQNPPGKRIEILEVKKESTVYDSNLALDKWWA